MKKFRIILGWVLSVLFFCFVCGVIFLFATKPGYDLRIKAAGTILSTQHRELARFTFLPDSVLAEILENIERPRFVNSSSHTKKESNETESVSGEKPDYEKLDLEVTIEDISDTFVDHYYKGKLVTINNPLNVHITHSKGSQGKGKGEQLPVMAKREQAIVATNANGFNDPGGNGWGGDLIGISISNGAPFTTNRSFLDGKDYVGAITNEGDFLTGFYSPNELLSFGVTQAAGFKPQLIVDGKRMITSGDGGWGYGPRTIMGQKEDGSILLAVVDGRQSHSIGASMLDMQELFLKHGAINAIAMDGGSSAALYYDEEIITVPSSQGHIPRWLPNAWVVTAKLGQKVTIHDKRKK